MIELDLNPNFESKIRALQRNDSLARIISNCERGISANIRSAEKASPTDKEPLEDMLNNFLSVYVAINEDLPATNAFSDEKKESMFDLCRIYSVYAASKVVLNKLNDEVVEKIREAERAEVSPPITYADVDQKSDYSLLSSLLQILGDVKFGGSVTAYKYNLFCYFDALRKISKDHLKNRVKRSTLAKLNTIKIYKTGFDFSEIAPVQKREFSNGKNERAESLKDPVDRLPSELPLYDSNPDASLEKIIGNTNGLTSLRAAIIRAMCYDSQTRKNPFRTNGCSLKNSFIVYGDPGVGKTLSVDALVNHFKEQASKFGKKIEFVDLSKDIKSPYHDKSAQILERYFEIERNSEDTVYVNIIDEAEGVFTIDEHGNMTEPSKKLLRELKKSIGNSNEKRIVNIFITNYPEQFEVALKQRFTPLKMEGPTNPYDFTAILRQELGYVSEKLSEDELRKLGEKLYDSKIELGRYEKPIPFTGRSVKSVASYFTSGQDEVVVTNEDALLGATPEQISSSLPKMASQISYDLVMERINFEVEELKKSESSSTARYNRRR